jgi:hypothetical protein
MGGSIMSRNSKIIAFSVPPPVFDELNCLARELRKTKSELFRDMIRIYQRFRGVQEAAEDKWIMDLIEEAKVEAKGCMREKEEREYRETLDYGTAQAKKLGIKSEAELERYLDEK